MKLYLARHTETNYNVAELCNADPSVDVHLTEKGIEQARQLALKLKDIDFEVIYISGLPRTRETASYVNTYHDKGYVVDERLNDNKTGYESQPSIEWRTALTASGDWWNTKFNDGESLNEAAARAQAAIDELRRAPYESVFMVAHHFIIQAIYASLEGISLAEAWEFEPTQGEYFAFEL